MSTVEYILIALGLSMDAFAVSLAAGVNASVRGARPTFRLAFHFGLFQFLMPVIGWYIGTRIQAIVSAWDHWAAFGLLAVVGVRMIYGGGKGDAREPSGLDPSRGWSLVLLSIATSIDAWAIGLSLAMLRINIWYPSLLIGAVTALVCAGAVQLGNHVAASFGKRVEILGGLILLGCGVKVLLTH
jgi:putative Mn2+ efflux pump MntP